MTAVLDELAHRVELQIQSRLPEDLGLAATEISATGVTGSGTTDVVVSKTRLKSFRPQGVFGDYFRNLRNPHLMILGPPGSGKTTCALNLAADLLRSRASGQPVPVILPACRWDAAHVDFDLWLARYISIEYLIRYTDAASLVADEKVIPFVDGIDEMPVSLQSAAMTQLTGSGFSRRAFVATSRSADYAETVSSSPPVDQVVVSIEPLDSEQIATALEHASEAFDDNHLRPAILEIQAHPDGPLAKALSSPLLLSLLVSAYRSDPTFDVRELIPPKAVEIDLADLLIETTWSSIFRAGNISYPSVLVAKWLGFLASEIPAEDAGKICWWNLTKNVPKLPIALNLLGGAVFVAISLTIGIMVNEPALVIISLLSLAVSGIDLNGPSRFRAPRQIVSPSLRPSIILFLPLLILAIGTALVIRPLSTLISERVAPHFFDLATVAVYSGLLAFAIVSRALVTNHAAPEGDPSAFRKDITSAAFRGLTVALPIILLAFSTLRGQVSIAASIGLALITVGCYTLTQSATGQYVFAWVWLALRRAVPWRLQTFLTEAERAGILRRIGGHLVFQNVIVQERFVSEQLARFNKAGSIEPFIEEIVEEVLHLPEAMAYIGPDDEDARRERLQVAARNAATSNIAFLSRLGAGAYDRFSEARMRMAAALRTPVLLRPAAVYREGAWLAASVAFWGAATILAEEDAILRVGAIAVAIMVPLALTAVLLVRARRLQSDQGQVQPKLNRHTLVRVWFAGLATCTVSIAAPNLPRHDWLPVVPLVAAILFPALLLTLLTALPFAIDRQRVKSENPADWLKLGAQLGRRRSAAIQARRDWLTTVARDGVAPIIRRRFMTENQSASIVLPRVDPARLGNVHRTDQLIDTGASKRVSWLLANLESSSIGISGPRGAGKSTMMQKFCAQELGAESEDILVLVQAPTTYDRREFLVHLFTEVCQRVVGLSNSDDQPSGPKRLTVWGALPTAAVLGGLFLVVGTLAWGPAVSVGVALRRDPGPAFLFMGVAAIVTGTALALWLNRHNSKNVKPESGAEIMAYRYLEALRYQSTFTRARNGKISIPIGWEIGGSGQVQRTEQLLSYPELVAQFRSLLDLIALERRLLGGRIVIGIDELDKMGSSSDAEQFLNDTKGVFGVPGCHFLVSVSEDALTSFDRRSVSVRTTFDSAFDGIVSVEPLRFSETKELLERRGIVLPNAYLWLCQLIGGGVPRETLRAVMTLTTTMSLKGYSHISELADVLIGADVAAAVSAQLRHASELEEPSTLEIVSWLSEIAQSSASAECLERFALQSPITNVSGASRRIAWQSRTYLYYSATLMRLFVGEGTKVLDAQQSPDRTGALEKLAMARAQLATFPEAAWEAIEVSRESVLNAAGDSAASAS